MLLDVVQDQSGKQYKMDHYATRYPTNVEDIAGFLTRVIGMFQNNNVPCHLVRSKANRFTAVASTYLAL